MAADPSVEQSAGWPCKGRQMLGGCDHGVVNTSAIGLQCLSWSAYSDTMRA